LALFGRVSRGSVRPSPVLYYHALTTDVECGQDPHKQQKLRATSVNCKLFLHSLLFFIVPFVLLHDCSKRKETHNVNICFIAAHHVFHLYQEFHKYGGNSKATLFRDARLGKSITWSLVGVGSTVYIVVVVLVHIMSAK
jgi:hypothetical protein